MLPREAEEKQLRIYRAMKPERKLQISHELYQFARQLVESSIREYYPDISAEEPCDEIIERFYGKKHVTKVEKEVGRVLSEAKNPTPERNERPSKI